MRRVTDGAAGYCDPFLAFTSTAGPRIGNHQKGEHEEKKNIAVRDANDVLNRPQHHQKGGWDESPYSVLRERLCPTPAARPVGV